MTVGKIQNNIMTPEEFNKSPLKNVMSYQDYFIHALKTGSAFTFNTKFNLPNNQIFNFNSNPIKDNKKTEKEEIYEKLANIKNPELAGEIENILQGKTPDQEFIDLLIKRYEKKQAEFEEAWARYQEAKGNRNTLKNTLEKLQKKYSNSESDYENGLVAKAERNFKYADLNEDVLLSIASYLAHRVV